ncbi:uncharacterized protein AB675_9488 [Cyphellophora attinorum]|uniref:Uncharacterized protein n=1 Tax=Cyphellophora attinorum TaxID=1664694 RepID=A0A0N1H7F7_9EURO|nr:uncharacterized protein AB675_9488 [Phialophora attinorum]KPI42413.1 hypothetical protein AB675_9488 [Phialophora attinorum]
MATNGHTTSQIAQRSYAAFKVNGEQRSRIGHYDFDAQKLIAMTFKSGTPLSNLYEVIEVGEDGIVFTDEEFQVTDVKLLAPISGRDVLAVGKNYVDHAKEFNSSGYDSSDKVDIPTHPVIFTKRATSIIAHGEEIYPHPKFTDSVDYEGEIGVIVGKPGYRIQESEAMDYVWGYTIINDMTARERQRDHKQFYIGKSPDTFCPMGPVAVPKSYLPDVLKIETRVNGEQRQSATTEQLIFSIPHLIKTLSEGQTIQPGDVIATGTPAGVGFGFRPMIFLKPGDEISVTVTGLGTLSNRIAAMTSKNYNVDRVTNVTVVPTFNEVRLRGQKSVQIDGKTLYYKRFGSADAGAPQVVCIHGLGGTSDYFTPLVRSLGSSVSLHVFDFEGHGLSATSASSQLSLQSLATDTSRLLAQVGVDKALIVAHSLGSLIAVQLALDHPEQVAKLLLMGPPPSPLPEAGAKAVRARASTVRALGMAGVVDAIVSAGTSSKSQAERPLAISAVRLSLMGQDPEGYAKACTALSTAPGLEFSKLQCPVSLVTGAEDKTSPPDLCKKYQSQVANCTLQTLEGVGHWHLFEDVQAVQRLVSDFVNA